MSTETTLAVKSTSGRETEQLGEAVGRCLEGGEIIQLSSDLGGGKTTFTKGLARGIGSKDIVNSPTFMVSRIYNGKNINIHHFDFYRLGEAGLMSEEIQDVISDKNNVLVIEWGGLVEGKLPLGRVLINIDKDPKDQNSRLINFHIPGRFKYLAGKLQPRIDT